MAPLQEVVRQQMRFDHRFTVAHAFDRFDIDRDGTISLKELRIGLRALAKVCLFASREGAPLLLLLYCSTKEEDRDRGPHLKAAAAAVEQTRRDETRASAAGGELPLLVIYLSCHA